MKTLREYVQMMTDTANALRERSPQTGPFLVHGLGSQLWTTLDGRAFIAPIGSPWPVGDPDPLLWREVQL